MALKGLLIIAGLAGATVATPALSQQSGAVEQPCANRNHVAGQLRDAFGERMVGSGLASNGVLFELYVGPAGTWTLLVTTPDGSSCLAGAGEAWEPLPEPDVFAAR